MSTLNIMPFIATNNAFARREERVPAYIFAGLNNQQIPEVLDNYVQQLEEYLIGMVKFGQENDRKEDGFGERTYHLIDLENLINTFRSVGIAKSYPDFMENFKKENGWGWIKTDLQKEVVEGQDKYKRVLSLGDESLDTLYQEMKDGKCYGLDCVDFTGKIHRFCKLLKIKDLHPPEHVKRKEFDAKAGTYVEINGTEPGVDSDLYLIVTQECADKGSSYNEETEEVTLKGSQMLRSPLGFVTMRRSLREDPVVNYQGTTNILSSICPPGMEYFDFDKLIAKATIVVNTTTVPEVIVRSVMNNNAQATMSQVHLDGQNEVLDYLLSPQEEEDGFANLFKGWHKLTGQHHNFESLLAWATLMFNSVPKVIDDRGGVAGQDISACLCKVLDIKLNPVWAIVPEFEAIIFAKGMENGTSSLRANNPRPYYIHVLDQETLTWKEEPCTKYILADARGAKYFFRGEDPFKMVDPSTLPTPKFVPVKDLYRRVEEGIKAMADSVKE